MPQWKNSVLVVDDNEDIITMSDLFLKHHFNQVITASSPIEIKQHINHPNLKVVLLDMNFKIGVNTGDEGLYWLKYILEVRSDIQVILMTAYGEVDTAVEAIRLGAADFIMKPWQNEKMLATLKRIMGLKPQKRNLPQVSIDSPIELIGESASMLSLKKMIEKVGPTKANVLITGENGTGKNEVAKWLHFKSERAASSLQTVDLGAVSNHLFESELFGHVKGAFTDAHSDREGRIAQAHEGTLFLDEVANIPLSIQSKLLTVLQSGRYFKVGDDQPKEADVRLISATNGNILEMIDQGQFRQDLLYRLNTVEIKVPSLRERKDDLPALIQYFIEKYAQNYQKQIVGIEPAALQRLTQYPWPGNIRELSHVVERAIILTESTVLQTSDFQLSSAQERPLEVSNNLNLLDAEKKLIEAALLKTEGNVSHAAQELGITRTALYRRMTKHDLI